MSIPRGPWRIDLLLLKFFLANFKSIQNDLHALLGCWHFVKFIHYWRHFVTFNLTLNGPFNFKIILMPQVFFYILLCLYTKLDVFLCLLHPRSIPTDDLQQQINTNHFKVTNILHEHLIINALFNIIFIKSSWDSFIVWVI